MIHGDVFRCPPYANLFSALMGSGAQIFFTILLLLTSVVLGVFKVTRRCVLLTAVIVIYALFGVFGGMASNSSRWFDPPNGCHSLRTCVCCRPIVSCPPREHCAP